MMAELIPNLLFYAFAITTVLAAAGVILSKNPVYSVFFLIFAFFNCSGLFVLLGAEYIAMTLVIVYVGAVAVLFLFVVMMLDINIAKMREGFVKRLPLALGFAGLLLVQIISIIYAAMQNGTMMTQGARSITPDPEVVTNTHAIGQVLYTDYFYPFQMSGLILLIAMIGAITLTLRQRPGVRKQKISQQVARKREDSVALMDVPSGKGVS